MSDLAVFRPAGEIAAMLGCSRATVDRLRKQGRIKGYRLGRTYRYDVAEVLAALKSERVSPDETPG